MDDLMATAKQSLEKFNYWRALRLFRAALETSPRSGFIIGGIAESLLGLRRYPEAEEYCKELIRAQPEASLPHVLMCRALAGLKDVEAAEREANLAFQLDGRSGDAAALLSFFLLRAGKVDDTILLLEQATSVSFQWLELKVVLYRNLGVAYLRKKDFKGYYSCGKKCYQLKPSLHLLTTLVISFEYLHQTLVKVVFFISLVLPIFLQQRLLILIPILILMPRVINMIFSIRSKSWRRVKSDFGYLLIMGILLGMIYYITD